MHYRHPRTKERIRMPMRTTRALPRLFLLRWNNSNAREAEKAVRMAWHESWGVLFPNGCVSLDFGTPFSSMTDLKEHVEAAGAYIIHWIEEEEEGASDAPEAKIS